MMTVFSMLLTVVMVSLQFIISSHAQPLLCGVGQETCTFCPQCSTAAEVGCTIDEHNKTVACIANTSSCDLVSCESSQYCLKTFFGSSVNVTNTDILQWQFSSFCSSSSDDTELCVVDQPTEDNLTTVTCHFACLGNCTGVVVAQNFTLLPLPETTATQMISAIPTTTPPATAQPDPPQVVGILAGVICGTLLLLLVLAILAGLCYKLRLKCQRTLSHRNILREPIKSSEGTLNEQPWQLMGSIGQGRYGYVYKADYQGTVVAVKIFGTHSRTAWENERNIHSMESTAHENIMEYIISVTIGAGITLQRVLVTKYYHLGSLNSYLQVRTLNWNQGCIMIRSISRGLAHLHSESYLNSGGVLAEKYSIAHRDMKSNNILVKNESGECVLGDLGFALLLDPSMDAKQLANAGRAGTFRYMAPEALDASINLNDLQSFKHIDMYAFALIMWEIMSRTCVLTEEDIPNYQLPYEEEAGRRPTLETLKDIVVTRQLRPSLPAIWGNHEHLNSLQEILHECWDKDPEARLTAGNVLVRMDELCGTNIEDIIKFNYSEHVPTNVPGTLAVLELHIPPEHSQSSPPPYYSPTDPVPFHGQQDADAFPLVSRPVFAHRRPFFQTSMPHIVCSDNEHLSWGSPQSGTCQGCHTGIRCTRSLRSSVHLEQEGMHLTECNSNEALSLKNSLLGSESAKHGGEGREQEQFHENRRYQSEELRVGFENYTLDAVPLNENDTQPSSAVLHPGGESDQSVSNVNTNSGILNPESDVSHSNATSEEPERPGALCKASADSTVSGMPTTACSRDVDLFKDGSGPFPPLAENSSVNSVSTVTSV